MSDQGENLHCFNAISQRHLPDLLTSTLPLGEPPSSPSLTLDSLITETTPLVYIGDGNGGETDQSIDILPHQPLEHPLTSPSPIITPSSLSSQLTCPLTVTSIAQSTPPSNTVTLTPSGNLKSKMISNSSNHNNDLGSLNLARKQSSPSTPSTAIDFFTFKWLFKKRSVPFLKKSSSSIFPEASEAKNSSKNGNHAGGVSVSGSTNIPQGLSNTRSNSRSAGSRLDCQSIPGTAKPFNKLCNVTPFISRLTEESNLKSTLKMKLSYSFGDIDDFSKWSNLENETRERQPLNPMNNDDHQSIDNRQSLTSDQHRHSSQANSHLTSIKWLPKNSKLTSSIPHLPSARRPLLPSSNSCNPHRESLNTSLKSREMDLALPPFNSSMENCFLCLNEVPSSSMHTIWSCGCRFCINCLQTYLTINIKENNNVCNLSCPDSTCPEITKLLRQQASLTDSVIDETRTISSFSSSGQRMVSSLIKTLSPNRLTPQEIQLLVPEETFQLYKKYKLYQEVDEDPNRTWCPKPNCVNICIISKPHTVSLPSSSSFTSSKSSSAATTSTTTKKFSLSVDNEKSSFFCQKCNETYCNLCRKSLHPGSPCWPSGEENDLALLLNPQSDSFHRLNNIKRCPRCSVWIERDDGCAQMMCRKCKHVFCWFCLQSLEDDFLLRHYDKGPCKNKLGHSRPSVIWHRTQVIAIFAGFGLLLLLASPLFLIASPCILCCNCCCGSSCKYLDDSDPTEEEDGIGVVNL